MRWAITRAYSGKQKFKQFTLTLRFRYSLVAAIGHSFEFSKSCHCCITELYIPLVDFLQEEKSIYCVVLETFYELMLPQICEPLEVLTWDAEVGG